MSSRPWGHSHARARRLRTLLLAISLILAASVSSSPAAPVKVALAASSSVRPNLFDPTTQAQSINRPPAQTATAYTQVTQSPPGSPMGCKIGALPMQPATISLSATVPSHFVSNDGSLTVDIPAGAISTDQIGVDGGSASLLVRQILPASGSNAGGSGHFSFGTYMLQVIDAKGQLATHGLSLPTTLTFHYANRFEGANVMNAYAVLNPSLPPCVNPDPTSVAIPSPTQASSARLASAVAGQPRSGPGASSAAMLAASIGKTASPGTTIDSSNGTFTTVAPLNSPTNSMSWGTNSAIATFGKPNPFEVNLSGAALTAGYPIDVPAGPKGFKPPLTLAYNSAGVNDQHNPQGAAGWVGEGWNLTLGSITWAEHYVNETGGAQWENSWELDDPFGTSATLVPPKTNETIYWDDTGNAPDYGPTQWQTVPETFAKVYDYQGTYQPTGWQVIPCWRVFLRSGVMEEFGCTPDSVSFYPGTASHPYLYSWLLDLIIEPDGNQVHVTYQEDAPVANGMQYIRDSVPYTVEWDSPGCLNRTSACTGAQWAPQMRVFFQASHSVAHVAGSSCPPVGTLRCDDAADLSGSNGVGAPLVQSDYVLNDTLVQINNSGPNPVWNTLRDYQFAYDQNGPTTITDPVSGKQESTAGKFNLTQLTVLGDDSSTPLPVTNFTYTGQIQYYEDSLLTPTPSTNCGPSWNQGYNPPTCRLWSQSYGGNSYYLSSVSNGLGLAQSFTWVNLRDNMHGVTSGGDPSNPLYCTLYQNSQFPCDMADDETWSRIGLSQQTNSLVRLTQAGQGGTQTNTPVNGTTTYTYKDTYPLNAQECPTCVAGYSWGNQDDNDYLDFYNGKFMGFAQATVANPDNGVEVHKFYSTEGWGVYNSTKVQITCPASPPDVCHTDPWWDQTNALHGNQYELDRYATDGTALLAQTLTSLVAICTPSWVPAGSPPVTMYGNWDGNLVNTLDLANPVAPCWIVTSQVQDITKDGSTAGSAPIKTTSYTYENAARPCSTCWGRLISQTTSSNDGGANGSPTSITNKTSYTWDDTVCGGCRPVVGSYLVDFVASSDTEDGSGNRYQCIFNRYDGQAYTTGQSSNLLGGDLSEVDHYSTTCGSSPSTSTGPIVSTYGFDSFGNPIWSTDPDGHAGCPAGGANRTTCTTFDGYFDALVKLQTNAVSQTVTTSYGTPTAPSNGFGLWPMSVTDVNNQVTSYTYDVLGRLATTTLPGETSGATQSTTYKVWCSGSSAQSPCAEIDQKQTLNSTTTVTSRAFYDGMGHLVETRSPAPGGLDVVQYYFYDYSQRLIFKSVSYFVTAYTGDPGSAAYSIPDSTIAGTSYTYDGLGRTTSIKDALSNTTNAGYTVVCNAAGTGDSACYEQVMTVDPLNHTAGVLTDALGRINYEQRYTGTWPSTYAVYATTKYTYDYVGDPTQILHPDGSTKTTYQYDLAGRQTGMTDPDRGIESYVYDPVGNLTQSTDARGSAGTVYVGYDVLNRPTWRNTTNTPTGAYDNYYYDDTTYPNHGVGRLTSETFTGPSGLSGGYNYVYDVRGQQTSATLTIGSTPYPLSTTYDDAGSVLTQTYPDGETVTNSHGSQDWLSGVSTSQGSTTLLSSAGYAGSGGANGSITSASWAGGTYQYSASFDLLGRATDINVKRASDQATMFDQTRTFDAAGNVSTASTTLPTGTDNQAFCYDEQNRLTWAGSAGTPPCTGTPITTGSLTSAQYVQGFTYDVMGRISTLRQGWRPGMIYTNSYTYGSSAHVHAATQIWILPGRPWYTAVYDLAGNMSCRAASTSTTCNGTQTGAQLVYNNDGQLASWQNQPNSPTSTAAFLYDGQGNRVAQQATSGGSTTTTAYIGGVEEDATTGSSTTKTTYYYANGQRFATAVNGSFSYLASDGLGSANVTLTAGGTVTASVLYAPYGSARYTSGTMPTDHGFTGQIADSTSGLDYYGARYYDPVAAQFTSADTVLPGSGYDVWGLSRYAYVGGNPINRTDPTGRVAVYDDSGGCYPCASTQSAGSQPVLWNPFTWHWGAAGTAFHKGTSRYEGASANQVAQAVAGDIDLYTFDALGALDHAMGGDLAESQYYKEGQQIGTPFALANVFLGGVGLVRGGYALYRGLSAARGAGAAVSDLADTCAVNSFSAGTLVLMADGSKKPIEQLKVGERVMTGDPQKGFQKAEAIQRVIVGHGLKHLYDIQVAGAVVEATYNHPLWVIEKNAFEWAQDLKPGEHLLLADGRAPPITSISHYDDITTVYNLSVADIHTFYVGQHSVLVHNSCFTSPDPGVGQLAHDIEAQYPGQVVGTNVPVTDAVTGRMLTDFDVETQNAVIQMKTGSASGLGGQLGRTALLTNKVVLGYAPDASAAALASWSRQGYLVTNDLQTLLGVLAP